MRWIEEKEEIEKIIRDYSDIVPEWVEYRYRSVATPSYMEKVRALFDPYERNLKEIYRAFAKDAMQDFLRETFENPHRGCDSNNWAIKMSAAENLCDFYFLDKLYSNGSGSKIPPRIDRDMLNILDNLGLFDEELPNIKDLHVVL